jgi:hypothetical protein
MQIFKNVLGNLSISQDPWDAKNKKTTKLNKSQQTPRFKWFSHYEIYPLAEAISRRKFAIKR